MRKGCRRANQIRTKPSVFDARTSFRAKGLLPTVCFCHSSLISCERVAAEDVQSQFYRSFCHSNFISCESVAAEDVKSQFYCSFWHSNLILCERVATSWRFVGTACGLRREKKKKERTVTEGKRQRERERGREKERERERKREREKMWRCENMKMYSRPPLLEEPFAQTLSGIICTH